MTEAISYKGDWQVPGSEHWFSGTLTYDPVSGGELEIVGAFNSAFDRTPIALIWGRTSDGRVTLLHTKRSHGQSSNVTRMEVVVYKPSVIFAGHAFESLESIAFRGVKISYFNLLEWLDPKSIHEERPQNNYKLEYTRPDPIEFACYDGCHGSVEFSLGGSYGYEQLDIRLYQQSFVRLQYDKAKSYSDIHGYLYPCSFGDSLYV